MGGFIHSCGGIQWYCEQSGSGADIVLIPSGEGDCGSFGTVAADLARDFRVTTFDTPGFSRSQASQSVEISIPALGGQVAALVRSLGIEQATFYGCSSAGVAALDIAAGHPDLARQVVVHEAALNDQSGRDAPTQAMASLDDAGVTQACAALFMNVMNEDQDAWRRLGEDFHRRLAVNYPTWIRRYVTGPRHKGFDPADLAGRPITWTIGDLFEVRVFFTNVQLAHHAGLELATLPCKHFPQVSIPGVLAEHIRRSANAGALAPHVRRHRA